MSFSSSRGSGWRIAWSRASFRFAFGDPVQRIVALKLLLLVGTAITGAHARLRILPRLTPERRPQLAWHVGLVTAMAIALLISGATLGRAETLLTAP